MASSALRTNKWISAVFFSLVLVVGTTPARACPLFLTEIGRTKPRVVPVPVQELSRPLVSFSVRPQGAGSPWVQSRLEKRIGFTPAVHLRLGALAAGEGVETPQQVDLGVLKPTGKTNPDGTEIWIPDEDSVLSGRIEVDVRGDGLIVRQKVLRPARAPGVQFAPLLEGWNRPSVQVQGKLQSPSETEAPLAAWLKVFWGKLQEIVVTP